MKELIRTGLDRLNLSPSVPENAAELLEHYGQALIEKNKVMNLTAITEPKDVATLHMLDCAPLLDCARLEGKTLIDVGTGAGFPGMVLKILVPSLNVTLLDSLRKRLDWLDEVAADLALTGVRTHPRPGGGGGRRTPRSGSSFDFATARAVADLRLLCELCLPFVKVGGRFLAMKSVECGKELGCSSSAIETLGGKLVGCVRLHHPPYGQVTPSRWQLLRKYPQLQSKYPRRWAKMQKAPL